MEKQFLRSNLRFTLGFQIAKRNTIMGLIEAAIAALVIALIAGALGFTNVAAGATIIAKWLFAIFLIIALLLFAAVVLGIGVAVG